MSPRAQSRRRGFGWVLVVGGAIGLVACLAGTVVAWVAIGTSRRASVQGLEVTQEALVSVQGSLQLADDVIDSVGAAMGTVEQALQSVAGTVAGADGALSRLGDVASSLPASLETARATLRSLAGVAATVDATLAAASSLPFVPDYQPPRPLGDVIGQLDRDLAPIEQRLGDLARDLDGLRTPAQGVTPGLQALVDRVGELSTQLDTAGAQVDGYLATARRASTVVADARADIGRDLTALRWIIPFLGIGLLAALAVPVWLGGSILGWWRGTPEPEPTEVLDKDPAPLAP